jgi:ribose transport system ATP-binding protein
MKENSHPILSVEGVSKNFGGVQALDGVSLDVRCGEVHALVGENGAGKTTLMNIIGGIVCRDAGRVVFKGNDVSFGSPADAQRAGIAVIHQELAMLPTLSVVENIYMGRMASRFGLVAWRELSLRTREVLKLLGLEVDIHAPVRTLSISERQLVEIARALSSDAALYIMDEPNSSLSQSETERLFAVIGRLRAKGVAVLYVSHKIEEVLAIADRVSVLRDGRFIGTLEKADATVAKIIHMMVARELAAEARTGGREPGPMVLEVGSLTGRRFRDVSFDVRRGEIVGLAGLVGAGRSDVARAVFGAEPWASGEIRLEGRPVRFSSPREAIRSGLAMVPEDRKVLSLFMDRTVLANMTLARLPWMARAGVVNGRQEREAARDFAARLSIRMSSLLQPVRDLSGGNQQKTVLARWLLTKPKLLILDEPTHGVDVGAKAEIYRLMRRLAQQGVGILLISSELPEILSMSDRIVVMCEGRVTAILDRSEASEHRIMACAAGVTGGEAVPGSATKQ